MNAWIDVTVPGTMRPPLQKDAWTDFEAKSVPVLVTIERGGERVIRIGYYLPSYEKKGLECWMLDDGTPYKVNALAWMPLPNPHHGEGYIDPT